MPLPEPTAVDLKVSTVAEILSLLREIHDKGLLLTLAASDGRNYTTKLRTIESDRQVLSFGAIDAEDPRLHALLEAEDVIALAYLDRIKVQFQLDNLLLVNSSEGSTLLADLPQEMYRFQRRDSFRVQPMDTGAPRAALSHPQVPERSLRLRILDVSMGGIAVFLPEDAAPQTDFAVGTVLGPVQLQLDRSTQFEARLRVQHVTDFSFETKGVQLGCAFESLSASANGILQRYIDHTQKRQRMLHKR